jgi:hypothetical protein
MSRTTCRNGSPGARKRAPDMAYFSPSHAAEGAVSTPIFAHNIRWARISPSPASITALWRCLHYAYLVLYSLLSLTIGSQGGHLPYSLESFSALANQRLHIVYHLYLLPKPFQLSLNTYLTFPKSVQSTKCKQNKDVQLNNNTGT